MATFDLIMMVPVCVRVENQPDLKVAVRTASDGLADWSKAQSGGKSTGYAVTLLSAEEVTP